MSDMPVQQEVRPPATSRRTAWVMVIIMTALLVLALLGTVWGFLRQAHIFMAGKGQAKAETAASVSNPAAVVTLVPGARIVSATTEAGKLVLHVDTASGGEVEIIDLATGKLTGQVKTQKP